MPWKALWRDISQITSVKCELIRNTIKAEDEIQLLHSLNVFED